MKEHQHVEWKESWRDEYLKWICGFANAEGGVLEIGRDDTGTIVGLAAPEFRDEATGLWSVFRFVPASVETPVQTPVETLTLPVQTGKTPEQILALLVRDPHMPLAQVAATLGKTTRTVERAVAKLGTYSAPSRRTKR